MARMFGPLPRGLAVARLALPARWSAVLRPLASSTAGILFGAALVGVAALRLAPEPPVTPVLETVGEAAAPVAATPATAAPTVAPAAAAIPAATAAPVAVTPPTVAPATEPPPSVAPAPAASAIEAVAYRSGGRSYAALTVVPDTELASPLSGRVEVRTYQLINGEIRTGANVAGIPYYPYVVVRSGDRVLTLRPGALGADSEILVRDGATVAPGTLLVRVTGSGASSWRAFYDRSLQAQVVVSLTTTAGGDLDAVPLFRH